MRSRLLFPVLSLLLILGGVAAVYAQTMPPMTMPANCGLGTAAIAFCDNFSEGPYTGSLPNRGGDLSPLVWSAARGTSDVNVGQGQYETFYPDTEMFCQTPLSGVVPDRDSFMCNGTNGTDTTLQGTEDMHWMTSLNDHGQYIAIGANTLQPFDFANRTGTISFMVDAVTRGFHSFWPDVVLSDSPMPLAHESKPGLDAPPRNGVEIDFNAGCGTPAQVNPGDGAALSDYPQTTVGQVSLFNNYGEKDWNPQALGVLPCAQALRDSPNHIVLKVSQTSLDIYMSDHGQDDLQLIKHLDQNDGFHLNFTQGYLALQQAHYNAEKFNGADAQNMTYHWHEVGFDGPILPTLRAYEVPDSLTNRSDGGVNIGYDLKQTLNFVINGVDITNADAASVVLNFRNDAAIDSQLRVSVNGGPQHPVVSPAINYATTAGSADIPITELQQGTNTLTFTAATEVVLANINLNVHDPMAVSTSSSSTTSASSTMVMPTDTPTPTATSTATPTATPTSAPTATPTTVPTATPTVAPSATPTATATPSAAAWSTTIQAPAQYGGHGIPVACTADPQDWHTLDCKAHF